METATKWKFQEVLDDEEFTVNDLPKHLKDKVTALKLTLGKYTKNPTDSLKVSLEKQDLQLSLDIFEYIDNLPTAEEAAEIERKRLAEIEAKKTQSTIPPAAPVITPAAPTAEEVAAKAKEVEEAAKLKASNDSAMALAGMEQAIKAKIDAHKEKRISTDDLKAIIGREPSHPMKVGSLEIRKIYPLNWWRIA